MAGISQSKQVWHSTAMRNWPPRPVSSRATSRSAASTCGSTASASASRRLPVALNCGGTDLRSNSGAA